MPVLSSSGARSACSTSQSHEPFGWMQLKRDGAWCSKFWSLHLHLLTCGAASLGAEPDDLSLNGTPIRSQHDRMKSPSVLVEVL